MGFSWVGVYWVHELHFTSPAVTSTAPSMNFATFSLIQSAAFLVDSSSPA
jgi:hypothetical protein